MAWTSTDLAKIEDAIRGILDGKTISFGGKTVSFESIKELRDLRQEMADEIKAAAAGPDDTGGFWMVPTVRGY